MGNCCNSKDPTRPKGYDEIEDCEGNQAILDCFLNQTKKSLGAKSFPAGLKLLKEIPREYLRVFRYQEELILEDTQISRAQNFSQLPFLGPVMMDKDSIYLGQFQGSLREGQGIQFYSDGSFYLGFWLRDQCSGYGILVHSNGDKYRGEWKCNHAHGEGLF